MLLMHLIFSFDALEEFLCCYARLNANVHLSCLCFLVEWRIVSLRVLSDITLVLLSQEVMEEERKVKEKWDLEGKSSNIRLLTLITEALLPQ